jgi:predicted SprT family Zn-dependent metalloprotease
MNLMQAETMALRLMREHGARDMGFTFRWTSSRKALGITRWRRVLNVGTGRMEWLPMDIALSRPLTVHQPEDEVRQTILHEIAHALAGHGHNHDHVWRTTAISIGAKPSVCGGSAELARTVARYRVWCEAGSHAVGSANSARFRTDRRVCATHRTPVTLVPNNA